MKVCLPKITWLNWQDNNRNTAGRDATTIKHKSHYRTLAPFDVIQRGGLTPIAPLSATSDNSRYV